MTNGLKLLLLAATFVTFTTSAVAAGERATAEEAVALVQKVVEYMKKNGREKTIAEIQSGSFKDKDLYVSINGMDGMSYANGGNPKMVGKNLTGLKDADGKEIQKERVAMATAKGKGWQDFKWVDPVSKTMTLKTSYFEKYEDLLVSCGIYKSK